MYVCMVGSKFYMMYVFVPQDLKVGRKAEMILLVMDGWVMGFRMHALQVLSIYIFIYLSLESRAYAEEQDGGQRRRKSTPATT